MLDLLLESAVGKVIYDFNNYMLTREDTKRQLDLIKETIKSFFINEKQKHYSDYIDILKFIVDLRTDVAKDKIYIPYKDRFNRVYYVEQLIW